MTIQELGSLGEFVAAIATVVTLIYLAIQIRHNTTVTQEQNMRDLLRQYDFCTPVVENPGLAPLLRRGLQDFGGMNKDEQARFHFFWHPVFLEREAMWRAHRKGLLGDQDLYSANIQALVAVITTEGGAQWWDMEQTVLSPEFVGAIAAEMRVGDAAKPITELWHFLQPDPSDSGNGHTASVRDEISRASSQRPSD